MENDPCIDYTEPNIKWLSNVMNEVASNIEEFGCLNKILKHPDLYVSCAHQQEELLVALLPIWQSD